MFHIMELTNRYLSESAGHNKAETIEGIRGLIGLPTMETISSASGVSANRYHGLPMFTSKPANHIRQ